MNQDFFPLTLSALGTFDVPSASIHLATLQNRSTGPYDWIMFTVLSFSSAATKGCFKFVCSFETSKQVLGASLAS